MQVSKKKKKKKNRTNNSPHSRFEEKEHPSEEKKHKILEKKTLFPLLFILESIPLLNHQTHLVRQYPLKPLLLH